MTILTIRIEPWPPVRGRKRIMVDGVHWGTAEMHGHGGQGISYTFEQKGEIGTIIRPSSRLGDRASPIRVYSDKIAEHMRRGGEPPIKPLEERMLDAVRDMIAKGLLRHPDVVLREHNEAEARWQAKREREKAETRKRDLDTARGIIDAAAVDYDGPDRLVVIVDRLAQAIADAFARERERP